MLRLLWVNINAILNNLADLSIDLKQPFILKKMFSRYFSRHCSSSVRCVLYIKMSLPKVISQQTYDDVVLENVIEFDKTLDEAIEEATQEFQAQVINSF